MLPLLLAASSRNLGKKRDQPPANRIVASAAPPLTAATTDGLGNASFTARQNPACQKHRAPPPENTTESMSSRAEKCAPSVLVGFRSEVSCRRAGFPNAVMTWHRKCRPSLIPRRD